MDFVSLNEMIAEAKRKKKRKIDLFGAENFRSWMLYFVPGDGTDMHYHASPETFLVLEGKGVVKGINGEERPIAKNEIFFLRRRIITRSPTPAQSRWCSSVIAPKRSAGRISRRTEPIGMPECNAPAQARTPAADQFDNR
jgi:hypothetical protein